MVSRRAACEFPNDNPELHDGLVWTAGSVCGAAVPTLRLRPVAGKLPRVLGPAWAGAEPAPEARLEPAPELALEPASELAPVLAPAPVLDETPMLPDSDEPCLEEAPAAVPEPTPAVSREALPEPAFESLVRALTRVALERGATRVAALLPELIAGGRFPTGIEDSGRARALVAGAAAWRDLLEGTASDLASCGELSLDAWAAELLAVLLDAPSEREVLRRALRGHGVAAFGMRQSFAA